MSEEIQQLTEEEILEKIHALEGIECSQYKTEDNYLMYAALHFYGEKVYQEAVRVICDGMKNMVSSLAGQFLVSRGNAGKIRNAIPLSNGSYAADPDQLNDMIQYGYETILQKIKNYDPRLGQSISSYCHQRVAVTIKVEINKNASVLTMSDSASHMMYDIGVIIEQCKAHGNPDPSPKDIYNVLKVKGKDMKKYSISTITNLMKLMVGFPVSLEEEMEKVKKLDHKDESAKEISADMICNVPIHEIVSKNLENEAIYAIIEDMNPLNKMAINALLTAQDKAGEKFNDDGTKKDVRRISMEATEKDTFKEFKKLYQYPVRQEDFAKLLYYAKLEFGKRFEKYRNVLKKTAKKPSFNTMISIYDDRIIDDIFDTEWDEAEWQQELEEDSNRFARSVSLKGTSSET